MIIYTVIKTGLTSN